MGQIKVNALNQGFGRERDENREDLYLRSIAFLFQVSRLWNSILVIKMTVRFEVFSSLPKGDDSGINSAFFKTNYWVNKEALSIASNYQIKLKWLVKII